MALRYPHTFRKGVSPIIEELVKGSVLVIDKWHASNGVREWRVSAVGVVDGREP